MKLRFPRGVKLALALVVFLIAVGGLYIGYSRFSIESEIPIKKPIASPPNSLAVFSFRYRGGPDSKFLASGFARALSDRLLCAPRSLTLQPIGLDINEEFRYRNLDPRTRPAEELACEIAACLGCRWAITGDLSQNGEEVSIAVHASCGSGSKTLTARGKLSDLPKMQTILARRIADLMGLSLNSKEARELETPNFSRAEALVFYGKSFEAEKVDAIELFRWKAWEADPGALFPALRLLEMYAYGPADYAKINGERRLVDLTKHVISHHAENSHARTLIGILTSKRYKYHEANGLLRKVIRDDPNMYAARQALMAVAYQRRDDGTALREASEMVRLWSSNPKSHAQLGLAHYLIARNAQQSRRVRDMWLSARRKWQKEAEAALEEARIAIGLNPRCAMAWRLFLYVANDAGKRRESEKAFRHLIRLDPRDWDAYLNYAISFSDSLNGNAKRQKKILAMVDNEFGSASPEAYLIRAYLAYYSRNPAQRAEEMLDYVNKAVLKSKTLTSDILGLKFNILIGMARTDESLQTALLGFSRWPSPEWRLYLAKAYQFEWYRSKDDRILQKSANLLEDFIKDVPFDVRGRIELAWSLLRLGQIEEARSQLFAALKLDPGNEVAVRELERLAPKPPPRFPF